MPASNNTPHLLPDKERAEWELKQAGLSNPGPWTAHSEYVAKACLYIAQKCPLLDAQTAYVLGLLHDIGRYAGVTSEKHLTDGYKYCMQNGWGKAAQICISHAFILQDINTSIGFFDMSEEDYLLLEALIPSFQYDDYDYLVQLCDSLALPYGFCLLEKRFVDVTLRYGVHPVTIPRWKRVFAIKEHFEALTACSVYDLLPGIRETTFQ